MAELTSWKRKKVYAARAARMNAVLKRARVEKEYSSAEAGFGSCVSSINDLHNDPPTLDSESNQGSGSNHSDSENERPGEECSLESGTEVFDNEAAQQSFDDFMVSLPMLARKTLAVLLMFYFQTRQKKTVHAAALEAAFITGFNEKTIRTTYRTDYFANKGHFSESTRGKYSRMSLLNDETLRLEASMWVRDNANKKGAPNMTAASFCSWVNEELLPSATLPPSYPRFIGLRTATRWLHRLGFRPCGHRKGAYVDGHERTDVVQYRSVYLKKLDDIRTVHLPPPPCSDEMAAIPPIDAETRKRLVIIYHDESIFHTNEGQTWIWGTGDHAYIQPKSKGAGIMVSDFIDEHNGFLCLTDTEHQIASASNSNFPKAARALLEYGAGKEGYWTSEKFMNNVRDAVAIASFKYPPGRNTLCWIFDQSSCHRAYSEDALNVNNMNVHPGGAQALMRDTVWCGKTQTMVNDTGVAKGMKIILEERGINTDTMKADDSA
jgi:hypothetical protein